MTIKFALCLLGAVLLVQHSYTAPAPDASSSEEIGGSVFKGFITRLKLVSLAMDELVEIHSLIIKNGVGVFKKVLEDPKVVEVKTEAMEENLSKLRKFIDQIEKDPNETEGKIFELLDEFGEIVDKFKKDENLSEEEEIIKNSLNENGIEDFRNTVKDHFNTFIAKFIEEIGNYVKGLDEEEKKKEENLVTLFEKIKVENDLEKQFDLLDNFFSSDDGSSSESKE